MEYQGYLGKVEFDDEAAIFHGEVINTRDVITFQGKSWPNSSRPFANRWTITWRFVPSVARSRTSHFRANLLRGFLQNFIGGRAWQRTWQARA